MQGLRGAARSPERAKFDKCFDAIHGVLARERTAAATALCGAVGSVSQAMRLADLKELDDFMMNSDAPSVL